MSLMHESLIYLLAAIIMVSVSRRLGFGSVLGYLAAGIAIGPFGIALIRDPEHILHFAELGVVFLVACYSILRKTSTMPGLLALGDLSIQGNIKPVRPMVEPLQVAMDNGPGRS